ncbi:hypothetical protein CCAN12_640006 [Capnocytophaga canimorsus]|uniref:ATP-grasp domain-containing protein n=1 Tax=Capnocytophaga canimorsus TaxID=28188 RepID=A0A0B7H9F8_9FLAO|nr:hypothetical protein CCAN12_640006 [Capnocytophaga canimorsus]
MTDELRQKMGAAAVKAAEFIKYEGAGTVEFLVDKHRNFYFMEMNTRIQVEHPITEQVIDYDLIREQILVAAGVPISGKKILCLNYTPSNAVSMPKILTTIFVLPLAKLLHYTPLEDTEYAWIHTFTADIPFLRTTIQ